MAYYSTRRVGALTADIRRLDRRLFPENDIPARSEWWEVRDPRGALVAYAAAEIRGSLLHLTRVGVSRPHRGRRLQRQLIRVREAYGRRAGCTASVTYAHQRNYASLNSLLHTGYFFASVSVARLHIRKNSPFVVLWRPLVRRRSLKSPERRRK